MSLAYGFEQSDVELFCEANALSLSNNDAVSSFTDQSGKNRHLTAVSSQPTFQTNIINGKPVLRWNGSQNPLSVTAGFKVRCGWILAKYNGASFPDYKGLLTDLTAQIILTSNNSGTNWFDAGYVFEYRSNDRIYPASSAPAPMNSFKLIFFRFWQDFQVSGIMLGQDRDFSTRKWNGDVPLVILSSRDFLEEEIIARSQAIATAYNLTLADVYKYQADIKDTPENPIQSVNFYDPPEGDRISEVLDNSKLSIDLKFSVADQIEIKYLRQFFANHYAAALSFIYRDYRFTPPEDIEGYFDAPYELDGSGNDWQYSFRFKQK